MKPIKTFFIVSALAWFAALVSPPTQTSAQTSALANDPSSRIGPELPQPDAGTNVICNHNFSGITSVINHPNTDPNPTNTVPCRRTSDPTPTLGDPENPSNTVLRLWIDYNSTLAENRKNVIAYAHNLNSKGLSQFPNGALIVFGVELNNLDSNGFWNNPPQGTSVDLAIRQAAQQYAELFNEFASIIHDNPNFPISPAPPDLYNTVYSPLVWINTFNSQVNCSYIDYLTADVFDIPSAHASAMGHDRTETWRYLEESICSGKKVVHFQGWGPHPEQSVRQHVDFLDNTPLPEGIKTATTLIPPNCGSQKADHETWWYYINGKVYTPEGIEINPDTCDAPTQKPGIHSCHAFCRGTTFEPCRDTPQDDCSIPFDWNYILSPVEDQNELSDITRYLLGIFQHATVPPGYHFTLGTNLKDPDKCRHIPPTEIGKRNRCESATGGASISYIPQKTINTVTAPVDYVVGVIRNMYTTGFNFFADSLENTTLLDQGVIQRSLPPQIQWKNLAALEKLKERCYQMSKSQIEAGGRGRILDYIQDETFGPVRCANFISIDDPTGQYLTEREIFIEYERYGVLYPGPLFECVYQPTDTFSNQICEDLLFNSDNNISPKVVNVIRQLPQYPIATLPVIGATDRLAPEQDPNHSSLHPSLFQRTRSAISNLILDLQGSSSFSSQDLHTTYYLTTITAGQDTHLSTKLNAQTTLPRGILENQNNQVRTLDKPLLTALTQTFDGFLNQLTDSSDSPFHWRHIPDENKDPRMLAINLFFNRPENLAACLDTSQDSDHTPNERSLDYQGEIDQRVNLNVGGLLAKLFTLLNSEEGGVSSEHIENNNIDLQRFVDCRAYPNSLKAADIYSYETSQALLPHQDPNRTNEFVTLVNNPEDVTLEASGKIAPPTKTCSNSIENYENWKICLAYPVACSSITPRPEPPCCQLDGEVTDDPNRWQCVNNEPLTELEAKVEETSPNKGSTTFGGGSIFSSVHNVFYKALNPVCNSKFTKAWDFFTKNECGVSLPPTTGTSNLCFYSGGFPIASQSFKQVIVSAANKHSVPIQLLLAMIQGENCRFKGGTENVCNLTQDQFFQPGVEYPASNNCILPGSGSDPIPPASWDGLFKGFVTLNKFAHHNGPNGWVESRDPQFTNVCSIHDATFGIANVLAESFKKTQDSTPSSQDWTREQLEDVVVHWVTGQRKLNGCSTQASDLPSGGVWTPEVQNTALAGIKIFCGYLDQLYNPSDPLYVNTTCQ